MSVVARSARGKHVQTVDVSICHTVLVGSSTSIWFDEREGGGAKGGNGSWRQGGAALLVDSSIRGWYLICRCRP